MFSAALRSALATVVLSAIAVSAAPSLSLKVGGSDSFVGVDSFSVSTTVTNTGDEALTLIKDPRGALSSSPTETFTITDASGRSPSFTGKYVKYVPSTVVSMGLENQFVTLAPGQSISVDHDLGAAYNFTSVGEGKFDIEATNLFHYVDADKNIVPLYANSEVHTASLSGTLAKARRSQFAKRIAYNGCSSSQQSLVSTAASGAVTYATNAVSYLQAHTSSTTRYTTWFGTYTSARHSTVLTHYQNIVSTDPRTYTFDCTCDESGVYAYVYPDEHAYIYLCPVFWDAPATGTDSKAGTIVHETTHFTNVGSTQDYAYGQSAAKSLATSNPAEAIENADSHEYFAENNPALS